MSLNLKDDCYIRTNADRPPWYSSKKYLVKLLEIRGVTKLKTNQSISDAIRAIGGTKLTKKEKLLLEIIGV